jgi:hypothetical protein
MENVLQLIHVLQLPAHMELPAKPVNASQLTNAHWLHAQKELTV